MLREYEKNKTASEIEMDEESEVKNDTTEIESDYIGYSWSDVYIPGQNRTFGKIEKNETDENDAWKDFYEWE